MSNVTDINEQTVKLIVRFFEKESSYLERQQIKKKTITNAELIARERVYEHLFNLAAGAALGTRHERQQTENLKWEYNSTMHEIRRLRKTLR